MSAESCLNAIWTAAWEATGKDLSDEELTEILEQLVRRAQAIGRRTGVGEADALTRAAQELGAEEKRAAQLARRNAMLNLKARLARRGRLVSAPDPVKAMQAEIHGIATPLRGARFSAEAESRALDALYQGGVVKALGRAGLWQAARGKALEQSWVRELFELSKGPKDGGRPGITKSPQALAIAQAVFKFQKLAQKHLNDAGAAIEDYAGWIAHTNHDPDRIRRAGYDAWRAQLLDGLDRERTFADVEEPEKFLQGVYNALITGVHLSDTGQVGFKDASFTGPANLAQRLSTMRVLHWRDADAWLDYQQRFGTPSPLAAVTNGLRRAARDTALMRRWGTNPRAEFENDLRFLAEQLRDRDPEAVRQLQAKRQDLQNRFDALEGTSDRPMNRLGARIGSYLRIDQMLSKLGGIAFTHLSSGVTKAAELRYHGVGLLESYGDFLQSFVRGRGRAGSETREIMDLLGAGLEGMQRDLLGRFNLGDEAAGTLSKSANLFFKLSGLTYLVNAQKSGAEFTLARHLGRFLNTAHGDLPAPVRRTLKLYGLEAPEWEMVRGVKDHATIGERRFLTPDAALRIDPAVAEGHLRRLGLIAPKARPGAAFNAVGRWREDLALRLHAYFHDSADRAIITPGVAEKALLLQGTHPGTALGEALRFVAQFKQWPATAVRVGLGRELYGGQTKLAAAAGTVHMLLGSIVMGYLAMSLKDLTKGLSPRPPNDPKSWAAALMQGGGFGIMGDFLFGEYDREGHSFLETAAGPVLGEGASSLMDLWNRMKLKAEGEKADIAPEAVRLAMNNLPFANLFYTRAAFDYLFLYQAEEAMNPGFLRRYERRVQSQQHQHFFLRPSAAIGR